MIGIEASYGGHGARHIIRPIGDDMLEYRIEGDHMKERKWIFKIITIPNQPDPLIHIGYHYKLIQEE